MKQRRGNRKGFTLSELLMVVLILSLIIVILGSGIFVVKDSYEKITLSAEAQSVLSTTITKITDEFRYAQYIEEGSEETGGIDSFVSKNEGYRIYFSNDNNGKGIIVSNPTEQEGFPLLTDKTMTDGLIPAINYSYDRDENIFTATVTVNKGSKEFCNQEIKIKPVE